MISSHACDSALFVIAPGHQGGDAGHAAAVGYGFVFIGVGAGAGLGHP